MVLLGLLGLALTTSLGSPLGRAILQGLFCGSSLSEDDADWLDCSEVDSLLVSLRDLCFFLVLLRWLAESLLDEQSALRPPHASEWLLSLRVAATRRCLSPLISGLCRSSM